MSEQEFREGLRAALVDEPALSFDPDMLITKARRESVRRRALVAAGVATTAVAVAAVAVPTIIGVPRTVGPAGPGADDPVPAKPTPCATPSSGRKYVVPKPGGAPSPKPTVPREKLKAPLPTPLPTDIRVEPPVVDVCPPLSETSIAPPTAPPTEPKIDLDWPPAGITPAHYTAEQLRQRGAEMREHLGQRFAEVVPGATDIVPGEFGGEAAGAVADGQTYLEAFTGFTLNKARSAVDIWVSAPGADGVSPSSECSQGLPPDCEVDKRPDGSLLVIKMEQAGDQGQILSVTHYRTNGTAVRASGYNYDPTARSEPTFLPDIPVTIEQLTALATDPRLTF